MILSTNSKWKRVAILSMFLVLSSFASACSDSGGAKGTVIDVVTGKPIPGVEVVGTTQTNIESEQRYRKISTKTGSDGSFLIKGLRGKSYSLTFSKNGYVPDMRGAGATIPEKSNTIIEQPILMCPLPIDGPGVYASGDKPVKLPSKPFKTLFIKEGNIYDTHDFIYYDADDLKDVPHIRASRLIIYGNSNIRDMFRLWRHTSLDNVKQRSEAQGNYYCSGENWYQGARRFGSFRLGNTRQTQKISGDNNPENYWGEVKQIFVTSGPASGGQTLQVYDIGGIPAGYYFLAPYIKNTSWGDPPTTQGNFAETVVFQLD